MGVCIQGEGGERERERERGRERERERKRERLTCHLFPDKGEERLREAEYPPIHHTGGTEVFFTHKVNILSL